MADKKSIKELNFPENIRYFAEHTWVSVDGDQVKIGISDFAQDQLGDIIFVELPGVGDSFGKGEVFGQAESAKSVSSLYSPITGEVVEVNSEVEDDPEIVNRECYEGGWMIVMKSSNPQEIEELLIKDQYIHQLG